MLRRTGRAAVCSAGLAEGRGGAAGLLRADVEHLHLRAAGADERGVAALAGARCRNGKRGAAAGKPLQTFWSLSQLL